MSGTDPPEAHLDKLRALADARYYDWHARVLEAERSSLFADLEKRKLSNGRALKALRITHEQLLRAARKRISIYMAVGRKNSSFEMFSKSRLDQLRTRIMHSISVSLSSLKSRLQRQAAGVGMRSSSLLHADRYEHSRAEIVTAVNIGIARLRAEGEALTAVSTAPGATGEIAGTAASSTTQPEEKKKRGRHQVIPDERKKAAAELKAAGGTNREAAVALYGIKYPSPQQVKNVPAILKHYARVRKLKPPLKPNKNRG
jgi:hypothetical protein